MVDIRILIEEIGEVRGIYHRTTADSIYLKDALIGNSKIPVEIFAISKKYVESVSRTSLPDFNTFTTEELKKIIELGNDVYTGKAQEIIANRFLEKSQEADRKEKLQKEKENKKQTKRWDQLEANKKMFNVDPNFDISEYTSVIDRNQKGYKELEKASLNVVKDIQNAKLAGKNDNSRVNSETHLSDVIGSKWDKPIEKTVSPLIKEREKILKEQSEFEASCKNYKDYKGSEMLEFTMNVLSKKKEFENRLKVIDKAIKEEEQPLADKEIHQKEAKVEKMEKEESHKNSKKEKTSKDTNKRASFNKSIGKNDYNSMREYVAMVNQNNKANKKPATSEWGNGTGLKELNSSRLTKLSNINHEAVNLRISEISARCLKADKASR